MLNYFVLVTVMWVAYSSTAVSAADISWANLNYSEKPTQRSQFPKRNVFLFMAPAPFSLSLLNRWIISANIWCLFKKALHLSHVSTDLCPEHSECLKNSFSTESTHEMCLRLTSKRYFESRKYFKCIRKKKRNDSNSNCSVTRAGSQLLSLGVRGFLRSDVWCLDSCKHGGKLMCAIGGLLWRREVQINTLESRGGAD